MTYTTFAASILLFVASQRTIAPIVTVHCISYIEKALEILDVMAEGVVARKIANFIRPIANRLQIESKRREAAPPETSQSNTDHIDVPFLGVPSFDNIFEGNVSDVDYSQTGLSFLEGSMWDMDVFEDRQTRPTNLSHPSRLDANHPA